MTYSSDSELEHIARGVLDCTLPKLDWTHAAHFAAAFWMLADPSRNAMAEMPDIIRASNLATGVENSDSTGYHETITQASLRAARHSLKVAEEGSSLYETLNRFLASPFGEADWLLAYWSREALFSVKARRGWVSPDLAALPFE